jgi:hypothetical protein
VAVAFLLLLLSVREAMEGQAAEIQRQWSLGHHDNMIPHPRSFQMLQSQPYRPPVFTRLSSGRGGCRITAAAAAAAEREQHAAAAAAAAAAQQSELRRYHSLDLRREGQGEGGQQQQQQQQDEQEAGGWAGAGVGAKSGSETAPAGAAAGWVKGEVHSASLPPLPTTSSKDYGMHEQQQLMQINGGVVKQRSLDWGHKLCKTDLM